MTGIYTGALDAETDRMTPLSRDDFATVSDPVLRQKIALEMVSNETAKVALPLPFPLGIII